MDLFYVGQHEHGYITLVEGREVVCFFVCLHPGTPFWPAHERLLVSKGKILKFLLGGGVKNFAEVYKF